MLLPEKRTFNFRIKSPTSPPCQTRNVLRSIGSFNVVWPKIAPSFTDQSPSLPAQPDKSFPLKSDSNSSACAATAITKKRGSAKIRIINRIPFVLFHFRMRLFNKPYRSMNNSPHSLSNLYHLVNRTIAARFCIYQTRLGKNSVIKHDRTIKLNHTQPNLLMIQLKRNCRIS